MAPAAVAASATVKASTAAMEAAKAGLSSVRVGSRTPSMAEPTESTGVRPCLCVRSVGPVKSLLPSKTPVTRTGAMIEVRSIRIKTIAIDDGPAMRHVGVVVVDDPSVVMPIVSPVVPTPAEASK
jgi:hypothetical protein